MITSVINREVVITGIGLVTPLGLTAQSTFDAAIAGQSGIDFLPDEFLYEGSDIKVGGAIPQFDPLRVSSPREVKRGSRFLQMAMDAADQAWNDANLTETSFDPERAQALISSGIGGMESIEEAVRVLERKGGKRISAFSIPSSVINMAAGLVAAKYGILGSAYSLVSACASGSHSAGIGALQIASGQADIAIVGASEATITQAAIASYANMHALSKSADPQSASRPWDKARDGFVIAEGASVFILEEYQHALARGAKCYAKVAGFGSSSDAYHMTSPRPDGSSAALAMRNALASAQVDASEVGHINAHATSTPAGDIAECNAINLVFNDLNDVSITATKSLTGHLMGASGSLALALTAMSLKNGKFHQTLNLDDREESAEKLPVIQGKALEKNIEYALCNAFGFGGSNASVLLSAL